MKSKLNAKHHSQHSNPKQLTKENTLRYRHTQRVIFNTTQSLNEYIGP